MEAGRVSDALVYVWSPESKVHVAVQHDGHMLSNESCNLDDVTGERTVASAIPLNRDATTFCHRCFPLDPAVQGEDVTHV